MEATEDERKCEGCEFWELNHTSLELVTGVMGTCRRMPPIFNGVDESWDFPYLAGGEWCGEWLPAPMVVEAVKKAKEEFAKQPKGLPAGGDPAEEPDPR